MKRIGMWLVASVMAAHISVSVGFGQAPSFTTLYSFTGQNGDGAGPYAPVTLGANGVLYGATFYGGTFGAGTVFRLTPPTAGGAWTETVLYNFTGGNDGGYPQGGVAVGASGIIYGTTAAGGASGMGTVFKLQPPTAPGGVWTETAIHSFSGSDGATPYAGPLMIQNGVLYGTTELGGALGYGVVYQLVPSGSGAWTETVLHSFASGTDGAFPYASLIIDGNRNLYGTTANGGTPQRGTVFRLTPPTQAGGAWTETILHTFTGTDGGFVFGGVTLAANGVLYGTTPGGVGAGFGSVFSLTPPVTGNTWKHTVLLKMSAGTKGGAPHAAVTLRPNGSLLGTALSGGSGSGWMGFGLVFELDPPVTGSAWTEKVLYTFQGAADGGDPDAPLIAGPNGVFYGTTLRGGTSGQGTVFAITP